MEVELTGRVVRLNRELSKLDEFVLSFAKKLDENGFDYAIVSGYVAIVFGRSRGTEDVDIIFRKTNEKQFEAFWKSLEGEFDCLNADNFLHALEEYVATNTALRFARKNTFIPNMEFKLAKNEADEYALDGKLELQLNGNKLFISPLELQICYKLFLGAEKDLEDAKFLFLLFKEKLKAKTTVKKANSKKIPGSGQLKGKIETFDLKQLRREKRENFLQRIEFIEKYVEWLKKTPNKVWSHQQNKVINQAFS